MNLQDIISNIELNKKNIEFIEFLEEQYLEYYMLLNECDEEFTEKFMNAYKISESSEIKDSVKKSKLMHYFSMGEKEKTPFCHAEEILGTENKINFEQIKKLHSCVMKKDTRAHIVKGEFRNEKGTIGYFDKEGKPVIHHDAPDHTEIDELMTSLVNYYNKEPDKKGVNHPFIKGSIIHALLIHIQPFQDGNSRVARVKHYTKLWKDSNEILGINFKYPSLFFCQRYMFDKCGYRTKLNRLSLDLASNENWNEWIYYNLEVMSESLVNLSSEITSAKKIYNLNKTKKL